MEPLGFLFDPSAHVLGSGGVGDAPTRDGGCLKAPCLLHPRSSKSPELRNVPQTVPRGSKYPTFKDPGPKSHSEYGFWDQSPQILGT